MEGGCTVWADVCRLRGCESRSATRSSHSFCLTGELWSPNQLDVKKKSFPGCKISNRPFVREARPYEGYANEQDRLSLAGIR